jgi:hypothetical protein
MELFDLLKNDVVYDTKMQFNIHAFGSLSLNTTPSAGTYYITDNKPSKSMLYGMMENALGVATAEERKQNFGHHVLSSHIQIVFVNNPKYTKIVDLTQKNYAKSPIVVTNTKRWDRRLGTIDLNRVKDLAISSKEPIILNKSYEGCDLHWEVLKPYVGKYYASVTNVERLCLHEDYVVEILSSYEICKLLEDYLQSPVHMLYLGDTEGIIDVRNIKLLSV